MPRAVRAEGRPRRGVSRNRLCQARTARMVAPTDRAESATRAGCTRPQLHCAWYGSFSTRAAAATGIYSRRNRRMAPRSAAPTRAVPD
jgi:hypothetical protein